MSFLCLGTFSWSFSSPGTPFSCMTVLSTNSSISRALFYSLHPFALLCSSSNVLYWPVISFPILSFTDFLNSDIVFLVLHWPFPLLYRCKYVLWNCPLFILFILFSLSVITLIVVILKIRWAHFSMWIYLWVCFYGLFLLLAVDYGHSTSCV